jgi:Tfp pilus assembly protein PilN
MINLIPPEGHRAVKREYLLRIGTVWAILFAGVFFAGAALSIPTYVLVRMQLESLTLSADESESTSAQFKHAEAIVRRTNDIALQLDIPMKGASASEIIRDVSQVAPRGVSITSLQLAKSADTFTTVQVQGIAPSRNALASFTDALNALPRVARAEVPISDLARDVDLPFALTIELKID